MAKATRPPLTAARLRIIVDNTATEPKARRKSVGGTLEPEQRGIRREFTRLDEIWRVALLDADPPATPQMWRLSVVILGRADFEDQFLAAGRLFAEARIASTSARDRRAIIERLEQLRLIAVEWRGRGRAPMIRPLHLRRPGRHR